MYALKIINIFELIDIEECTTFLHTGNDRRYRQPKICNSSGLL